eukprot:4308717-Pleurochrysis_carterae.AAC.1
MPDSRDSYLPCMPRLPCWLRVLSCFASPYLAAVPACRASLLCLVLELVAFMPCDACLLRVLALRSFPS